MSDTVKITVDTRGDWGSVVEAIYEEAPSDLAWATHVAEAMRALLPRSSFIGIYSANHDGTGGLTDVPLATHPMLREQATQLKDFVPWVRAFHFDPPPISTVRRNMARLGGPSEQAFGEKMRELGFVDALGMVTHPRPGLVTVLAAAFDQTVELSRPEREHMTRVALHLEAGQRLRANQDAIIAELDGRGRPHAATAREHIARIDEARSTRRRRSPDGLDLWRVLLEGRASVVPRGDRYLIVENPIVSHRTRALTRRETAVLSLAARGTSSKQIGYAIGISPALVSALLRSAAAKIGALSRTDLVRLAALLIRDSNGLVADRKLTAAEEEVLALLEMGLRNDQIATFRMTSVRTIANQVASLLRKTGATSRRELVVRAAMAPPERSGTRSVRLGGPKS